LQINITYSARGQPAQINVVFHVFRFLANLKNVDLRQIWRLNYYLRSSELLMWILTLHYAFTVGAAPGQRACPNELADEFPRRLIKIYTNFINLAHRRINLCSTK